MISRSCATCRNFLAPGLSIRCAGSMHLPGSHPTPEAAQLKRFFTTTTRSGMTRRCGPSTRASSPGSITARRQNWLPTYLVARMADRNGHGDVSQSRSCRARGIAGISRAGHPGRCVLPRVGTDDRRQACADPCRQPADARRGCHRGETPSDLLLYTPIVPDRPSCIDDRVGWFGSPVDRVRSTAGRSGGRNLGRRRFANPVALHRGLIMGPAMDSSRQSLTTGFECVHDDRHPGTIGAIANISWYVPARQRPIDVIP